MELPGKRFEKNAKSESRAEAPTLSFAFGEVQSGHLGVAPGTALFASRQRIVTFRGISEVRKQSENVGNRASVVKRSAA